MSWHDILPGQLKAGDSRNRHHVARGAIPAFCRYMNVWMNVTMEMAHTKKPSNVRAGDVLV